MQHEGPLVEALRDLEKETAAWSAFLLCLERLWH